MDDTHMYLDNFRLRNGFYFLFWGRVRNGLWVVYFEIPWSSFGQVTTGVANHIIVLGALGLRKLRPLHHCMTIM